MVFKPRSSWLQANFALTWVNLSWDLRAFIGPFLIDEVYLTKNHNCSVKNVIKYCSHEFCSVKFGPWYAWAWEFLHSFLLCQGEHDCATRDVQLMIKDTRNINQGFFGTVYESTYYCLWQNIFQRTALKILYYTYNFTILTQISNLEEERISRPSIETCT
jgi:hypothetical protein